MKTFNRMFLLGNLAAEVDFRTTKSGRSLASFPVAVNRNIYDSKGKKREVADFFRVVSWGKLGEICHKYLAKGSAVLLEGRFINRSFKDKDGNKQFRSEVIAENVNILTWKKNDSGHTEVGVESIAAKNHDEVDEEEEVAA